MKSKSLKVLTFFLFLLFPGIILANSQNLIINEIAWMGTESSYSDEWIELYNNSLSSLNLEGWKLTAEDGTPVINLTGDISAKSFFILERTDDETLPNIKADLIYKGSLSNKGEYLKLITKAGEVVDEVNCSSGWFAGDNEVKRTMERKNPLASGNDPQNWETSQSSGGTPKTESSQEKLEIEEETMPETIKTDYSSNIFINEILPSPEGPDSENEWIEIFNQNIFEVDLSGWQITDVVGKTTNYTFPPRTIIGAKGFLTLSRPITKITLNNQGDSLILLYPNGEKTDRVDYEKAPRGESFNRTDSGWLWSSTLTPGNSNIVSLLPEKGPEESTILKEEKPPSSQRWKELAAIGPAATKTSSPLSVLLTALIIAFSSGIIVLLFKKSLTSSSKKEEID